MDSYVRGGGLAEWVGGLAKRGTAQRGGRIEWEAIACSSLG